MPAPRCKGGWESEFSSFYLAKPHLTQEGYLKGEVQAVNRTGPHGGGHVPSVGIPAEFPGSLTSLLERGFLLPPLDMPRGLFPQETGPSFLSSPCTSGRALWQCLESFRAPCKVVSNLRAGAVSQPPSFLCPSCLE